GMVAQGGGFMEGAVVAFAHKAAVALEMWKLRGQRLRKLRRQRRIGPAQSLRCLHKLGWQNCRPFQCRRQLRRGENAVANGGKVARAAAVDRKPGESARQSRG